MKKIRNWWREFYNNYTGFFVVGGIVVGIGLFIGGVVSFSKSYHENKVESNQLEFVKTEMVNGHSYITLRQKRSWDYDYTVLHDPDCNCNN